jgi:hypothetical protein
VSGWAQIDVPEFFVLGRVRMRMGFHWKPSFIARRLVVGGQRFNVACCPDCMRPESAAEDGKHCRSQSSLPTQCSLTAGASASTVDPACGR